MAQARPGANVRLIVAILAVATAPFALPAHTQPALPPIVAECHRLADARADPYDFEGMRKHKQDLLAACEQAIAIDPDGANTQAALGRAYNSNGRDRDAVRHFRAAAAQDHPKAWLELYERHRSWERGKLGRPQLVDRAEAERALRRAAELGEPDGILALVGRLSRGGIVKRDPAEAIYWAQEAMKRPPKDRDQPSMVIMLGAALLKSAKPDERLHGLRLLESVRGRGNALGIMAEALRAEDPVRARKLLEEAIRLWPGFSGDLAEMLLKGEGGPKNEKRAVSLVSGWRASDAPPVRAMYGRLLVEGRLVPRDLKKGIELIFQGSNDYDTRLELIRALIANPEVPLNYPDGFLYDATEAAELGEPGALAALIDLKLSRHVQFGDKAGGCALAAQAAKNGDADAAKRVSECN
jgi:TPR repeat protein